MGADGDRERCRPATIPQVRSQGAARRMWPMRPSEWRVPCSRGHSSKLRFQVRFPRLVSRVPQRLPAVLSHASLRAMEPDVTRHARGCKKQRPSETSRPIINQRIECKLGQNTRWPGACAPEWPRRRSALQACAKACAGSPAATPGSPCCRIPPADTRNSGVW